MKTLNRRRFLANLGIALSAAGLSTLGLSACSNIAPQPFHLGKVVKPPLGCQELLARDQRGDC
ncbi:MAG: twin-arginine translocation signal domain-containing protein [Gammaproteobacteria bacterium]|nr:twin-arginine translocation signal domain-containing protein [Gammaproteobacteria bacterium]MBU1832021.1 twin-arginine translocation signal domain-containing protein [Gammaproteobacteria bacterium]